MEFIGRTSLLFLHVCTLSLAGVQAQVANRVKHAVTFVPTILGVIENKRIPMCREKDARPAGSVARKQPINKYPRVINSIAIRLDTHAILNFPRACLANICARANAREREKSTDSPFAIRSAGLVISSLVLSWPTIYEPQ